MEKKQHRPSEKISCRCGKTRWETLEFTNYIEKIRCKTCGRELEINLPDFYGEHRGRSGKANEEVIKIYEEKCKKGEHPFEELYRKNYVLESVVVRYCHICGASRVDMEFGNKEKSRVLMSLRTPKILERR